MNIYVKRKNEDLLLVSFSSSSDIYDFFNDYGVYGKKSELDIPFDDIQSKLISDKEKLEKYRELARVNTDYLQDYMSFADYVKEEESTYNKLLMLNSIAVDIKSGFTDFSGIYFKCC